MKPVTAVFRASLFALAATHASARTFVSLDPDWKFLQADSPGAESPGFDDSNWRKLDVPHDWSIAGEFKQSAPTGGAGGWLPSGVAWYRKEITLPPGSEGKSVWIEFDGVMQNSDVWLNGTLLGHRPSGYFSFRYDVTGKIKPDGKNLLVVKADTSAQPASRWYSGGGIYRHVRMVVAHPAHIAPWGVFVSTPEANGSSATVDIRTKVTNTADKSGKITLRSAIVGPDGKTVATLSSTTTLDPGKDSEVTQQIKVPQPKLWSLETPQLHTLVTRIMAGETVLDEVSTPFGIRQAEFKADTGFWLNGKNFKIKGVCLHQDGGAVGVAVPLGVWERRFKILRELGVNAIRTAHTPPAPEFLDLCDRMGFLVMDEFFDCWTKGKNDSDYHLFFKDWSKNDLRDGILRDRNHPSIILYSVGNEIHDTPNATLAKSILNGLVEICHANDPTRPVTQALFRPNTSGDYKNGLADLLDVVGTNYRDKELMDAWKDKPTRKIIGTEQGHDRSSWAVCRDNAPYSGQFLWVGIDYLGESSNWPLTVYNVGLLDRTGVVQARGYERQSWWSEKPMVRMVRRIGATAATPADPGYEAVEWKRRQVLFPDWTPAHLTAHDENVEVYSNAEEVELFLNGKSLGSKPVRKDGAAINWQVPFETGTLKAVARTKNKEVSNDILRTAEKPAKIVLLSDHETLGTSWDDVANIEIQVVDQNGTIIPSYGELIKFTTSGPAKILGVDSGNVISIEPFQANERKAFQGRALAIVRAIEKGTVTLTASAEGLPPATITLPTTK
ncbi:MAG: glycoside hydrolase family 2 TIM barrel-domain containing protein [Luteolibacter sp.]